MTDHMPDDLSAIGRDLRAYTDELRPRHGVVRNVEGEWVLLRHALVVQAALDSVRFSSAVSSHLHVPNGFDAAEHAAYRQALDRFLGAEALAPFYAAFRRIAADLIASLPRGAGIDAVSGLGTRFAVRAQSAWLGWPARSKSVSSPGWGRTMQLPVRATASGPGRWRRTSTPSSSRCSSPAARARRAGRHARCHV